MGTAVQDKALEQARAAFLHEGISPVAQVVRTPILESWRRSALHGLQPGLVRPVIAATIDHDNQLVRAARPLIEQRAEILTDFACGIALTSGTGCVLERWVENAAFARRLDARGVVPGGSVAETTVGTSSSGIALETGQSVLVTGAEHFADGSIHMTSAGAPIRHPATRRIVGSVNLTCAHSDTTPVMLHWIRELAALIEDRLLDTGTVRERALLRTYLRTDRDSRHPVICMNEHTIICNAPAARLLSDIDSSMVWEAASQTVQSQAQQRIELFNGSGTGRVDVTTDLIVENGVVAGAELHLRRFTQASPGEAPEPTLFCDPAAVLPGMAGRSAAWQRFCSQLSLETSRPLLLTGEEGTGKTMAMAALAPKASVCDARHERAGDSEWLLQVAEALDSAAPVIVLDGLECLTTEVFEATAALIAGRGGGTPWVLAARAHDAAEDLNPLIDDQVSAWPGMVVRVPPIRERLGDIPLLVSALTASLTAEAITPRWSPEAIQTLSRVHWIGNVASLARLVAAVLQRRVSGAWITEDDLPTAVKSSATRRQLFGLDLLEAHAINSALAAADGNKKLAADRLGIARSTLYRKVRALGINLGGAVY